MKRIKLNLLFAGLLAFSFVSCNKELDDNGQIVEGEKISILATIDDGSLTKTQYTVDEGIYRLGWYSSGNNKDEIQLIVENGSKQDKYRLYADSEAASTTFSGYANIGEAASSPWNLTGFAIYPVEAGKNGSNVGVLRDDFLTFGRGDALTDVTVTMSSSYTLSATDMNTQLSCTPLIGYRKGSTKEFIFNTAVGVLMISLNDVPTAANAIRITSPDADAPLCGTFLLESGKSDIKMANAVTGGQSRTVSFSISEAGDYDFYIPVPVGTIPVVDGKGLKIELLDSEDSAHPIFSRSYTKSLTIERNKIIPVTLDTPEWKKLGTGKFIDNHMWGAMDFAAHTMDEVGFVDVTIYQNVADKSLYRIANPYGAASKYLADMNSTQGEHSDFLTFSIASDGAVTFQDCTTGFDHSEGNFTIKQTPDGSTAEDKLVSGTYTNPLVVRLAPDYYVGSSRHYSRNGSPETVKIIFPDAVATSTASFNLPAGNPYFGSGISYTNSASYISVYVSDRSPFFRFFTSRSNGYSDSTAPSTRTTYNTQSTRNLTAANLGVTTSYFPSSKVLYAYWYTYDSAKNVLMQGCKKFYYLVPSDASVFSKTFTVPTAQECSDAGSSKTPVFWYNGSYFSEPSAYTITFAVSDDLNKGSIMVTEFCGITGKAYGRYDASATYPLQLFTDADDPFCTVNGLGFSLREAYDQIGLDDGQDFRGSSRFKLNGVYYGGVTNSLANWGANFGLRAKDGTWGISVTPFFCLN